MARYFVFLFRFIVFKFNKKRNNMRRRQNHMVKNVIPFDVIK